jgi:hypothetical protein
VLPQRIALLLRSETDLLSLANHGSEVAEPTEMRNTKDGHAGDLSRRVQCYWGSK